MRLADARFYSADGAVIASLSGEIDSSNAGDLGEALVGALTNEARGLVVDLRSVAYLDSAGIHLLYSVARDVRARGQGLVLVLGTPSPTFDALRLAGVQRAFKIAATVDEGVQQVTG